MTYRNAPYENKSSLHTLHGDIREYLDAPHSLEPDAYIFQAVKNGHVGQPMNRKQLYRLFEGYARKAGVDVLAFPHMGGATMTTSAYEAGATGVSVQWTVGHSSITNTERYKHTTQKHREIASFTVGYLTS